MILQLRHATFNTQSLKEIQIGRETGLIDTGPFVSLRLLAMSALFPDTGQVFRVARPYLNLMVKPKTFFQIFWKIYNCMHSERQNNKCAYPTLKGGVRALRGYLHPPPPPPL